MLDKVFWGRANLEHTAALYYFSKKGKVQHLIHQLKYKDRQDVGVYAGKLLGRDLKKDGIDGFTRIVPVPLHPRKQRKRGYNQSEQFAIGLSEALGIPVDTQSFIRTVSSGTQTRKSRFARYENVREIFRVVSPESLKNQHILLVDDVITTGATLESCANMLLAVPGVKVSVASIAFATD
jgi:ComF family protein